MRQFPNKFGEMMAFVSMEKNDPERSNAAECIDQQETPSPGAFAYRDSLIRST